MLLVAINWKLRIISGINFRASKLLTGIDSPDDNLLPANG